MTLQAVDQYQDFCAAFTAFTKDMQQLTERLWKESNKQQSEMLQLCQDCSDRQIRALGSGDWSALAAEQSRIVSDFSQKWLECSQGAWGLLGESTERFRSSLGNFEPFWKLFGWNGVKQVTEIMDEAVTKIRKGRREAA